MVLIGFTGIFSVTALRKIFIIDYKLAYPSGTATGVLINSLHTPAGEKRVSHDQSLLIWSSHPFLLKFVIYRFITDELSSVLERRLCSMVQVFMAL